MTDAMIPYSFIPGTKAKAVEINANFEALISALKNTTEVVNEEIQKFKDAVEYISDFESAMDTLAEVKADLELKNVAKNIDFVIESWNAGSNWYRKYRSGWIEQGGNATINTTATTTNFNIPFAGDYTNISLQLTRKTSASANYAAGQAGSNTYFSAIASANGTFIWTASGY